MSETSRDPNEGPTSNDCTKIQGGIEFFKVHDKHGWRWEIQCARCGSTADFQYCGHCGGDGLIPGTTLEGWEDDEYDVSCPDCRLVLYAKLVHSRGLTSTGIRGYTSGRSGTGPAPQQSNSN